MSCRTRWRALPGRAYWLDSHVVGDVHTRVVSAQVQGDGRPAGRRRSRRSRTRAGSPAPPRSPQTSSPWSEHRAGRARLQRQRPRPSRHRADAIGAVMPAGGYVAFAARRGRGPMARLYLRLVVGGALARTFRVTAAAFVIQPTRPARHAWGGSSCAGAGPRARRASRSASRSSARSRLRACERASWAHGGHARAEFRAITRAFCASLRSPDARTSKIASIREAVTFAC